MKKILVACAIWFVLLNVMNKMSFGVLPDATSYELPRGSTVASRFWIVPWLNFDGRNYLKIATDGYSASPKKFNLRVFFPLYPMLIKILSFNLFINPIMVGLAISSISFLVSLFVFNRL